MSLADGVISANTSSAGALGLLEKAVPHLDRSTHHQSHFDCVSILWFMTLRQFVAEAMSAGVADFGSVVNRLSDELSMEALVPSLFEVFSSSDAFTLFGPAELYSVPIPTNTVATVNAINGLLQLNAELTS